MFGAHVVSPSSGKVCMHVDTVEGSTVGLRKGDAQPDLLVTLDNGTSFSLEVIDGKLVINRWMAGCDDATNVANLEIA